MPPTKTPKQRPIQGTTRADSIAQIHPSQGGTRGYNVTVREMALTVRHCGQENDPIFQNLRANCQHPSTSTTYRWQHRQNTEGHVHPYEMNGNRPAEVLQGHTLLMLQIFRMCYPKATAAEVNAFLFGCTLPGDPLRFFCDSQITKAEHFLGLSRKKAATTAYQASLPINLAERHSFWNDPYPYGIFGTSRSTIIDFDEAAIFVETTNRGFGKCYINRRAREEGPYNNSEKFTITAAIRGGPGGGCWVDLALRTGTGVMDTYDFLDTIINGPNGLGQGGVNAIGIDNTQTFICDNLAAHHNPLIHLLVNNNQHRIVYRAPYYPCDGPIEYFFNFLQQQLTLELY
jgi:hypothetical protein